MEQYRVDPTIAYDVIELPSRGIHYENKKKTVKVSYLTAVDENILSSPNLIATQQVVNELLRRKIIDKDLTVEELVEEDKQAILIFLRNTAFGTEYKITTVDPQTEKDFSFEVDLSTLKTKDFTLQEDENGEYTYYMEKSKVSVTFNFLNKKQEDEIDKIRESWNGNGIAPIITKQLEFMIKSINGNREPMQIRAFIEKMPIKDSQDFRKFVNDNKPGLNLTQTVTTPSGEEIQVNIGFGVEFFRPFYGL